MLQRPCLVLGPHCANSCHKGSERAWYCGHTGVFLCGNSLFFKSEKKTERRKNVWKHMVITSNLSWTNMYEAFKGIYKANLWFRKNLKCCDPPLVLAFRTKSPQKCVSQKACCRSLNSDFANDYKERWELKWFWNNWIFFELLTSNSSGSTAPKNDLTARPECGFFFFFFFSWIWISEEYFGLDLWSSGGQKPWWKVLINIKLRPCVAHGSVFGSRDQTKAELTH